MPEGTHSIARSGIACEYGERGGARPECWNYHPLPASWGGSRFPGRHAGDSPDGGDGANGTRGSDPIRCTSCGLRRLLSSNDPTVCRTPGSKENIYTEYIRK
ncbi:hypothetical protein AAFF_G00136620 [Aldrovandia affinis]|uniref:Uncharacterized protein n=1 Tax=Aldrovandia affinis TaxID=143900 RepID=A0AAD7VX93_9TELE|nr:hypothetical protein AAFF_G00136620 [Aldrovandia affinis]